MEFEPVIGMEVHAELLTESKVYCGCSTKWGAEPNTQCCPVCLGLPGSLPVVNHKAAELVIRAALALNCEIAPVAGFARKNYFYPDLTKGYQITQYDTPIGRNGYVDVVVDGQTKRIRIRRIHLEEDTGKSLHDAVHGSTLLDFNRAGVPLAEIVTEPDIRTPAEARAYLEVLKGILQTLDVSDCRIEEGSMRCEANISLREKGSEKYGTLCEVKNIGSFRGVERALEFEIKRQGDILQNGGQVERQTRRFDESKQETVVMRSKEEAFDYRYFPEPDLVAYEIDDEWVERLKQEMPELPQAKYGRYIGAGVGFYEAGELAYERSLARYFDAVLAEGAPAKAAASLLIAEVRRELNSRGLAIDDCPVPPSELAELVKLVQGGTVSSTAGKEVLAAMFETGKGARQVVDERGLAQVNDRDAVAEMVRKAIAESPKVVADYYAGKTKAIAAIVGLVMKASRGKANPGMVNEIIVQELEANRK